MSGKIQEIKSLIESNDDFENYFRNTIIPQLFIDADLNLRKFTPPAMTQFNLSADDIGKSIADIKDNFRFPSIVENIQYVMECNEILEKEIQTTDFRWFQMNIIPYVELKTTKINGVIVTFIEITARIKDLKEQEKLISDHETLLDSISHDIKNPLTSLLASIELLKKASNNNPKHVPSLIKIVENSIRSMQAIINDLTETRKHGPKYKSEEELLSFENILEDVRLTLSDNITESGAVIKKKISVSQITFSRRKLRSIVYNLLSNAIKFRSHDRKLEVFVTTECENGFIVITVKDNGIGISPEKKEAIFSKYFRVENKIEGTGVGLYLVNEIVKNAGGKILMESEPGIGSEFQIYLKDQAPAPSVENIEAQKKKDS
ncbi:ATP-binding protein [Daejeonella sp.]|uniref:sensor histidine kinase n=1 Tax=Daejeonella sp. TaxID=2805397 RepID=UPI0030C3ECA8